MSASYSKPADRIDLKRVSTASEADDLLGVPRVAIAIGNICLIAVATYFYLEQVGQPAVFDQEAYLKLAASYDAQGLYNTPSHIRTFAYPWCLAILLKISRLVGLPFALLLLGFQLGCYTVASLTIARVVSCSNRGLSGVVYVALCCNVFAGPYLGIALTDSLYISISLAVTGLLMKLEVRLPKALDRPFWDITALSILTGLAFVIRPAAIWLIALVLTCFLLLVIRKKVMLSHVLFGLCLGFVPLLIQIILNIKHFNVATAFPIYNLGAQQLVWGIQNFKYATWLGPADHSQFFYKSGYTATWLQPGSPVMWYIENPVWGVKLLLTKFIAAFDFDFLVPYPRSFPRYPWLASAFSLSFLYLGLWGTLLHLTRNCLPALGFRCFPLLTVLAITAVTIPSAVELRFIIPILSYFMVVTCVFLHFLLSERKLYLTIAVVSVGVVVIPSFFSVSNFVREQSPRALYEAKLR